MQDLTYRDLVKAQLEGETIQYWNYSEGGRWVDCQVTMQIHLDTLDHVVDNKNWRIKPVKPSINWEHVHPRYRYLARDVGRGIYLYEKEPYKLNTMWYSDNGDVCRATTHSSVTAGNCRWEDSLVERPR